MLYNSSRFITHARTRTHTKSRQYHVLHLINANHGKKNGYIIFSVINTLWLFWVSFWGRCQVSGSGAGMSKWEQHAREEKHNGPVLLWPVMRCISRGSNFKWCFLQLGFTCAQRKAQTFAFASSVPASVIALTCMKCMRVNSCTH